MNSPRTTALGGPFSNTRIFGPNWQNFDRKIMDHRLVRGHPKYREKKQ